jgi:hypothetical protein
LSRMGHLRVKARRSGARIVWHRGSSGNARHKTPSNGEVEGPAEASGRTQVERSSSGATYAAGSATRAHTVFQRPRSQSDHASRTPPTMVRRAGAVVDRRHLSSLAQPHRATARSVEAEREVGHNEATAAECSRRPSVATRRIPRRQLRRGNEGVSRRARSSASPSTIPGSRTRSF